MVNYFLCNRRVIIQSVFYDYCFTVYNRKHRNDSHWSFLFKSKRYYIYAVWILHGIFLFIPCSWKRKRRVYSWGLPTRYLLHSRYLNFSIYMGIKRYFSRSISESVHHTFVLETLFPFLQRVARAYNNLYTNLCKTYFSRSNRYGSDSMDFQFYPFPEERTFFRISAACCNYLLDIFFASIDRTFLFHRWYARFCCQNSKNNKLI